MRCNAILVGLLLAVVLGVAGCGGGGSDSGAPIPYAAGSLAKYEGTWVQACNNHNKETTTFTSSNNGNTISVNSKDEYFANADCTGAVVATGTYEQPSFILQYKDTVNNASVKMLNGATITATVDRGTGNSTGARVKYVGSGVTSSSVVGNITKVHIVYNNGSTDLEIDDSSGGGEGALLLLNNELLSLIPVTSNTFEVESKDSPLSPAPPTPSTPLTPAEIAANKLATLKQVEGNWKFTYSAGFSYTDNLTLSNVTKTTDPIIEYSVSISPFSVAAPIFGGFSTTEDSWAIVGDGISGSNSSNTGGFYFKTDGKVVLPGGCFYRTNKTTNVRSACYPLTGTKL